MVDFFNVGLKTTPSIQESRCAASRLGLLRKGSAEYIIDLDQALTIRRRRGVLQGSQNYNGWLCIHHELCRLRSRAIPTRQWNLPQIGLRQPVFSLLVLRKKSQATVNQL
jgi:hypothetical protein